MARPEDVSADLLLANLLAFGRTLRAAGLPLGSGQLMSFVSAAAEVDTRRRDDFYHAARSTLVTRPEQLPVFDAEFARFWRRLLDAASPPVEAYIDTSDQESVPLPNDAQPPKRTETAGADGEPEHERTILAVEETEAEAAPNETEEIEVAPEDVLIFSAREALRKKDFVQCTPEEIAEARRIIEGMDWRLGTRQTRRQQKANRGEFIDYRATLRRSMRHGGVPMDLRRRARKERMRPLVLICDISGSMDRYGRLLLRFVHALGKG
jgi:hypothetical protein